MLAEHLVYSAALAVIAGMLFFRFTGRDSSWIIILVSYAPDLDKIAEGILHHLRFAAFSGHGAPTGIFHNVAAMVIFAVIVAFLLRPFGIRYLDSFLFALIGFGAHLFEDALVYPAGYAYLWPFSAGKMGLGWLPVGGYEESYNANFFHIANAEVLLIGLVLLLIAILVRTRAGGPGWIRWYMPESVYRRFFGGPER
ncbi:MAG TPA: metal-dependent hydrolase [Methanoregula sp.]|nr:metal-dependent hydrolase [Methanoregula sp.]